MLRAYAFVPQGIKPTDGKEIIQEIIEEEGMEGGVVELMFAANQGFLYSVEVNDTPQARRRLPDIFGQFNTQEPSSAPSGSTGNDPLYEKLKLKHKERPKFDPQAGGPGSFAERLKQLEVKK